MNIFKKIFFTWTHKVLKAANNNPQLELSHLGKFSKELYPDNYLNEIKKQWQDSINETKSYPLIKALLKGNAKKLILIFFGSLAVAFFDRLWYNKTENDLFDRKEHDHEENTCLSGNRPA